jgi:phosphoribosylformylglycinamidine synthase
VAVASAQSSHDDKSSDAAGSEWIAEVIVTLKPVVNDPPGLSIQGALRHLGYDGVSKVRAGKFMQITLAADSREHASEQVEEMCRRLLANPVIETYRFTLRRPRAAKPKNRKARG